MQGKRFFEVDAVVEEFGERCMSSPLEALTFKVWITSLRRFHFCDLNEYLCLAWFRDFMHIIHSSYRRRKYISLSSSSSEAVEMFTGPDNVEVNVPFTTCQWSVSKWRLINKLKYGRGYEQKL